jgi:hypothetical protein
MTKHSIKSIRKEQSEYVPSPEVIQIMKDMYSELLKSLSSTYNIIKRGNGSHG